MAKHKPIYSGGVYLITFTCYQWLPLIRITDLYENIPAFFNILKKNGHPVLGYVIMPNHVHLMVHYTGSSKGLNAEIGKGKRFLAYEIIHRLKKTNREDILRQLNKAVKPTDRRRGKLHEVWIDSFDAKRCRTKQFILQKLIYMHNNPCHPRWKLASRPPAYKWSSAAFYDGDRSGYQVKDYLEVLVMLIED